MTWFSEVKGKRKFSSLMLVMGFGMTTWSQLAFSQSLKWTWHIYCRDLLKPIKNTIQNYSSSNYRIFSGSYFLSFWLWRSQTFQIKVWINQQRQKSGLGNLSPAFSTSNIDKVHLSYLKGSSFSSQPSLVISVRRLTVDSTVALTLKKNLTQ